mgnify:CR=1 FL=1
MALITRGKQAPEAVPAEQTAAGPGRMPVAAPKRRTGALALQSAGLKDVPVIEVHVEPGSRISVDDPLVTLESDKATMEVPSPAAGRITAISVKEGDRVSQGDLLIRLDETQIRAELGKGLTLADALKRFGHV